MSAAAAVQLRLLLWCLVPDAKRFGLRRAVPSFWPRGHQHLRVPTPTAHRWYHASCEGLGADMTDVLAEPEGYVCR